METGSCISLGCDGCEGNCLNKYRRLRCWYKPVIVKSNDSNGKLRVYKRYSSNRFPLKYFFLFLILHEYRMLKRVERLSFTPGYIERGPRGTREISYQYIKGDSIKQLSERGCVPVEFFYKLYSAVLIMHDLGIAHLDLGNSGNVLSTPEGDPVIIDFGAATSLAGVPLRLKNWMRKKDLLGVLKLWYRFDMETMPPILLEYYLNNYRKNTYTPKRFYKALKRLFSVDPHQSTTERLVNSEILSVIGLFFGLLLLVSLW